MKIVATIEARMGSSRLPGKTLKPILGKPMLQLMLERVGRARMPHEIVLATTTKPKDDMIAELVEGLGIACFRGSEDDVLDRVYQAAKKHGADYVVELTADCPLIDPEIIDQVVEGFLAGTYDYGSNTLPPRGYANGLDVEIFPFALLEDLWKNSDDPLDREHVSPSFRDKTDRYRQFRLDPPAELRFPDLSLEVNEPEDFERVRRVFEALYPKNPRFRTIDIIDFLGLRSWMRC